MRFVFAHRHPLPEPRSRSIQVVQTAAAAARAGAEVCLLAGELKGGDPAGVLSFHGIDPKPLSGRLRFDRLDSWGGLLFGWRAGRAVRRAAAGPGPGFLVLNELTPEAAVLAERAKEAGLGVLLDIQSLSPYLLQRGRPSTPPPAPPGGHTFSLVSPEGKKALQLVGEPGHDEGHRDNHQDDHHDGHPGDHDDKGSKPAAGPELPPNLDQTPAPPPPAVATTPEGAALLKALEAQADRETAILAGADGWIFRHQALRAALGRAIASPRPSVVLGWGATPVPASVGTAGTSREFDIIYCGRVGIESGVETLIAAMQTLIPHRLAVLGPMTKADKEKLRQAALSVGALERLKLLDPVPASAVAGLLAKAKVGALPVPGLTAEGGDPAAPLALFEMMAAGLPIVASRLKSLHEYAADDKEALYVSPDDPRPLADGLRKVMADASLRERLGSAARARAASLTWEARAAGLLEFAGSIKRS